MKKIIALLALVMLLSLAACGAEPAVEDTAADEPQNEQEVVVDNEAVVDEISEPIVETENSTEPAPASSDENEVEEISKVEEEKISVEESPAEESDSVSSNDSDNAPFGGLATYKGKLVRALPAETDLNNLANAQVDELVYIGNVLYQGTARVWTVKDASTPPENYVPTDGSVDMRDCNGSLARVFPEGYDTNRMLPVEPFERVYIGDVEYVWDGDDWGVVDNTPKPNDYTDIEGELDENGNLILDSPSPFH